MGITIACLLLGCLLLAPQPARAATLMLHYDASELTGFNNGDDVLTWPDTSGHPNGPNNLIHNTPAAGISNSVYVPTGIGGKPAVLFRFGPVNTGSGYLSQTALGNPGGYGIEGDAGFTMIWVVKETISHGNRVHIGGLGNGGVNGGGKALTLEIETFSANAEHRLDLATGWGHDLILTDTDGTPNDSWHDDDEPSTDLTGKELIITVTHEEYTGGTVSNTLSLFINGDAPDSGLLAGKIIDCTTFTCTVPMSLVDAKLQLAGVIDRGLDGFIAEILMYSNVLTTAERQVIEFSLSQKYSISGNFSGAEGTIVFIQ